MAVSFASTSLERMRQSYPAVLLRKLQALDQLTAQSDTLTLSPANMGRARLAASLTSPHDRVNLVKLEIAVKQIPTELATAPRPEKEASHLHLGTNA